MFKSLDECVSRIQDEIKTINVFESLKNYAGNSNYRKIIILYLMNNPATPDELWNHIKQVGYKQKWNVNTQLNYLMKRGVIIKQDNNYCFHPSIGNRLDYINIVEEMKIRAQDLQEICRIN